jgi:hypothetical protein
MAEVHPLLRPNCVWMVTRQEQNTQVTAFGRGQRLFQHTVKTLIMSILT